MVGVVGVVGGKSGRSGRSRRSGSYLSDLHVGIGGGALVEPRSRSLADWHPFIAFVVELGKMRDPAQAHVLNGL